MSKGSKKVSQDEKRIRLLEFFHEKKAVFLLKEVEKLASKEKGIPLPSIKDTLTSLVDDDLVDSDKIGTSTYFWSFPSKAYKKKLSSCEDLERSVTELQEQNLLLEQKMQEKSNESSTENDAEKMEEEKQRNELQMEINKLKEEKSELEKKFESLPKINHPEDDDRLVEETRTCQEAIDRWTENIFSIQYWCKQKFNLENSEINRNFGIPDDFDYFQLDVDDANK